jgi:hypothetical protein
VAVVGSPRMILKPYLHLRRGSGPVARVQAAAHQLGVEFRPEPIALLTCNVPIEFIIRSTGLIIIESGGNARSETATRERTKDYENLYEVDTNWVVNVYDRSERDVES